MNRIGRCVPIFVTAVVFDVIGVILLLIGIFAPLSYWDFLIFTGALIIALSLVSWSMWYTFNVESPPEEMRLL